MKLTYISNPQSIGVFLKGLIGISAGLLFFACAPVANSISKVPVESRPLGSVNELQFSNLDVVALDEDVYVVSEKKALWAKKQIPSEVKLTELTEKQINELIQDSTVVDLGDDVKLGGLQFFAVLELDPLETARFDEEKLRKVKLKWERISQKEVRISLSKKRGDAVSRKFVQTYLTRVSLGYRETTLSE